MADKNAHLTEREAMLISKNIEDIGKSINESSKSLDNTMSTLISGAEGEEIEELKIKGKQLLNAIGDLATSAFDIGYKIGLYINAMIQNDKEAAQKVKDSFN